ncbi:DUF1772 domain-containing protein [uncultured Psychroserpens sp.]|uniref:anthrone oxygenase family protein n=1 Tax=uncultured Psychroserpens sp. TaxID=255436 RepID=UPI00260AE8E2|nr:DUF1772 domain-containing protein [uncultured Psychroserpens sp.]
MNTQHIVLLVLIVFTGLSAGLCFTWSNAVTPGIGRLDDLGFLKAFQEMNRAILNPIFFLIFFGPVLLNGIILYLNRHNLNVIVWLLIVTLVIYFLGVVMVTIFGNVSLNEMLDEIHLCALDPEELKSLRESFEERWNKLHFVRTVTSTVTFIILIITLIKITTQNLEL